MSNECRFIIVFFNLLWYNSRNWGVFMEYKMVNLPDARVISFYSLGVNPEITSINNLCEYVSIQNILQDKSELMLYGFHDPAPKPFSKGHGYEVWYMLDKNMEISDKSINIKDFKGGLYITTETNLESFLKHNLWSHFNPHMSWFDENGYEYDKKRQWLEQLIIDVDTLNEFIAGFSRKDLVRFVLHMPIKKTEF